MDVPRVSRFVLILLSIGCNKPPGAPTVSIEPELPGTDDDLVATIAVQAVDDNAKDTISYRYIWLQSGMERGDLREDSVPASRTTRGERWEVMVFASDGKVDSAPATAEVTIGNTAPIAQVELGPAAPLASDDLEATASGSDADGDQVTFAYSWTVDGVQSSHAGDTVPATDTARGELWEVTVVPNDGLDTGAPVTAQVSIDNTAPELISAELGPEPAYETTVLEVAFEARDLDDDPISGSYAFYVNGSLVQEGAQATLSGEHFDRGQQVRAVVTPSDGFLEGESLTTNTVEILNSPPAYASVSLDPTEIYEDSTVSCLPSGWSDGDGDPEGYTVTWVVDGTAVSGDATIDGDLFDRGDELSCEVTPHDGVEAGAVVSSEIAIVVNSAPSVASATLSTISPTQADTLSVSVAGATDIDGDSITLDYAWSVNGVVVASLPSLSAAWFDKGDTIYVQITPSDGRVTGAPILSDTATAVNTPPEITSLIISPSSLYTDSSLVASVVTTDGDGDSVSVSYAWTIDGAAIGASGNTLSGATWFDKGQRVQVTATPNDGDTDGSSESSGPLVVLNSLPTAPTLGITPVEPIAGDDDLFCEILADSTDADGDSVVYFFDWSVNGAVHSGLQVDDATSSLVPAIETDDNQTWICSATPDDGEDAGPAGTASVDIGEGAGEDPCVYPDESLTVSTGPASGATFSPYYFSVDFIGTIEDGVVYDWQNSSGDQPAYIQFEFFDSSVTSLCSVYYDLDSASVATGWSSSSGGALYGAWEVPLVGGYTTCPQISAATWGSRDLRDLLESWTWGVGVGELVDLGGDLRTAVLGAGLDWTNDWAPYVNAEYVYSDLYGTAYEIGWAWGWEEECGVLAEDTSGDGIKLSALAASPPPDATWDGNGFLLFYASALVP